MRNNLKKNKKKSFIEFKKGYKKRKRRKKSVPLSRKPGLIVDPEEEVSIDEKIKKKARIE